LIDICIPPAMYKVTLYTKEYFPWEGSATCKQNGIVIQGEKNLLVCCRPGKLKEKKYLVVRRPWKCNLILVTISPRSFNAVKDFDPFNLLKCPLLVTSESLGLLIQVIKFFVSGLQCCKWWIIKVCPIQIIKLICLKWYVTLWFPPRHVEF
jgi:hypothetical protein